MRRRALLLSVLARPARAQDDGDRAAIRQVIEAQIDAFRRDDAEAAFGFASPMIQDMFATPDRFMAMVRGAYLPVYRPRLLEFGELAERDGRLVQEVELVGPDGTPALALYTMVRRPEGWRIDGVALTRSSKLAS